MAAGAPQLLCTAAWLDSSTWAAAGLATYGARRPPACARRSTLWAPESSHGRLGSAVQPCSPSEAPPEAPVSLRLTIQTQGFVGYERVKELELWRVTVPGQDQDGAGIDATQ